jgi:hypothetical protein
VRPVQARYRGLGQAALRDQPRRGRPHALLSEDELRFGHISDPRRCWAPAGVRPVGNVQMARQYEYVYGTVIPQDGVLDTWVQAGAMGIL